MSGVELGLVWQPLAGTSPINTPNHHNIVKIKYILFKIKCIFINALFPPVIPTRTVVTSQFRIFTNRQKVKSCSNCFSLNRHLFSIWNRSFFLVSLPGGHNLSPSTLNCSFPMGCGNSTPSKHICLVQAAWSCEQLGVVQVWWYSPCQCGACNFTVSLNSEKLSAQCVVSSQPACFDAADLAADTLYAVVVNQFEAPDLVTVGDLSHEVFFKQASVNFADFFKFSKSHRIEPHASLGCPSGDFDGWKAKKVSFKACFRRLISYNQDDRLYGAASGAEARGFEHLFEGCLTFGEAAETFGEAAETLKRCEVSSFFLVLHKLSLVVSIFNAVRTNSSGDVIAHICSLPAFEPSLLQIRDRCFMTPLMLAGWFGVTTSVQNLVNAFLRHHKTAHTVELMDKPPPPWKSGAAVRFHQLSAYAFVLAGKHDHLLAHLPGVVPARDQKAASCFRNIVSKSDLLQALLHDGVPCPLTFHDLRERKRGHFAENSIWPASHPLLFPSGPLPPLLEFISSLPSKSASITRADIASIFANLALFVCVLIMRAYTPLEYGANDDNDFRELVDFTILFPGCFDQDALKFLSSLTDEQMCCLLPHIAAVYLYTLESPLYTLTNRALFQADQEGIRLWQPFIHALSEALPALAPISHSVHVNCNPFYLNSAPPVVATSRGLSVRVSPSDYCVGQEVTLAILANERRGRCNRPHTFFLSQAVGWWPGAWLEKKMCAAYGTCPSFH